MHNFRKLEVWQLSRSAATLTYTLTAGFPKAELFGLTSQLRRAAISVGANIIEGSKRSSNKDFKHFLVIAEGSAAEAWFLLDIAIQLGYGSQEAARALCAVFERIQRMLCGLRKQLK